MRNRLGRIAAGCALALGCLTGNAGAQAPAPPPPAIPNPKYVTIGPMEIDVNRPVAEVWQRVGKWCDVSEWIQIAVGCQVTFGKEGEIGAGRSVGSEILVGRSQYSYTYAQPVRTGVPYNVYHGTLEARATSPTTTKLLYTLFLDQSMLADDAAREKDAASRRALFTRALNNMKILSEGGTLPPPPARGAPPAAPPSSGR